MGNLGNNISLEELLTPQPFERKNYCSHLYAPYSAKLHRRVNLYTHDSYDLWVRLESDQDTIQFNESVPAFPISLQDGRAIATSPKAISVKADGAVLIHTFSTAYIDDQSKKSESKNIAWQQWCDIYGFQHKEWTTDLLKANPIELANLKRLLRFVSVAGYIPDYAMERSILAELENVRKITFVKLVQQFPLSDPEEVQTSLARLIISRKVYSDIHISPLSMITEISAYHELSKN